MTEVSVVSEIFSRTRLIFGDDAMAKLKAARVAVFGAGGVGGYIIEALARSGIGAIDIIDKDIVSESNINRQIIALHSTIGRYKADVAAARLRRHGSQSVFSSGNERNV